MRAGFLALRQPRGGFPALRQMRLGFLALCTLLLPACMAQLYTAQDLNMSDYQDRVSLHSNNTVSDGNATCVCAIGFERQAGACVACVAGTFKDRDGDQACTDCPVHSTTLSNESETKSDCLCEPGWMTFGFLGYGHDCEQCAEGTYKHAISNHSCSTCPRGSTSQVATAQLSGCVCNAGYSGPDGGPCVECTEGRYKTVTGPSPCMSCAAGETSQAASAAQDACVCLPGLYGSPCEPCPVDTYKAVAGREPCAACPANSVPPEQSSQVTMCQCAAGFTGPDGYVCEACAAGKFKTAPGSAPCQACAGESLSGSGAEQCTNCLLYSQVMDRADGSSCTCNAGYARSGDTCHACMPGKYKPTTSNQACDECQAGSYQDSFAAQKCLLCLWNSYSEAPGSASSDTCKCNEGHTRVTGVCQACSPGTYKVSVSDAPCSPCDPESYSTASGATSADACVNCPSNTSTFGATGVHEVAGCLCTAGFQPVGPGVCAACDPDHFCEGHGNRESCMTHAHSPAGSQSVLACVCGAGYYEAVEATCYVCALDHYCPADDAIYNSTSTPQSAEEGACRCRSGFEKT